MSLGLPGRALLVASLLWLSIARPALADDVADEADLQFRIGAERYTAADYRGALEHFLASNRLAPNRNVVFNIARTYEKLERYPEAFRYYTTALGSETDPQVRERITQALALIEPHVAVLDVETSPPGATLYVDRLDLGSRGESPRMLGLAPGRYRIIAELAGHQQAVAIVDDARAGTRAHVALVLPPILSSLRIEGEPAGSRVFLDATEGVPRCLLPCILEVPPGQHALHVTSPGYRSSDSTIDVVRNKPAVARVRLDPVTGTVLVVTGEPGALIEVDGKSSGFTPTVLTLPVGEHALGVSRRGYAPASRTVTVVADRQTRVSEELLRIEEVQAASRKSESVEDAPSSVTIIPREELVAFGYPTVADALRGVRGLYVWNDRSYPSLGVRGVGRLGSYTNRELVLQDGHPTNDDWVGSAYVGFDGRTDLGDLERIEVVRGPGSVLYGTNAFSGVVNLVTRSQATEPHTEIAVGTADYGVSRARVRSQAPLGKDGGIWASVAGAHGVGRDFYFPELATTAGNGEARDGASRGADGFQAATVQGRVYWKWLSAQWFFHTHDKSIPTGEFETLLSDSRSRQIDSRGFVEVRADPVLSEVVKLESRLHFNLYAYRGDFARLPVDGGVEHDRYDGQWVGAEQRVVLTPNPRLRLTFGGEGQLHYRTDAEARDDSGVFLGESGSKGRTYQVGAVYALADATPSARTRLSLGVRLDGYSTFGTSLNPRAAFIVRPYERGNTKVLLGKAFRAPSIYELYYNDGGTTQIASPDLGPESIYSFEVEHSHRFSPTVTGLASIYANDITNLIVTRGGGTETDPLFYANSASPLVTVGAEVAVRREWRQGFMVQASAGAQATRFIASKDVGDLLQLKKDESTRHVSNSPNLLASLKAAAPVVPRALTVATRLTFEGQRYDRYELTTDPAQGKTDAAVVWDVILSGRSERYGIGYSVGAYNLGDYRYSLPVSAEFSQRTILQNGRTFLASLDLTL